MADLAPYLFGTVLTLLAIFMILLVLVQRGRGGGLTGALGGVGGSSAFGAKAGDVFTKITVVAAAIWIVTCVAAAYWSGHRGDALGDSNPPLSNPDDGTILTEDEDPRDDAAVVGQESEQDAGGSNDAATNEGDPPAAEPAGEE